MDLQDFKEQLAIEKEYENFEDYIYIMGDSEDGIKDLDNFMTEAAGRFALHLVSEFKESHTKAQKLMPLNQMTREHFELVFDKGYTPEYIQERVTSFRSMIGFYTSVAAIGKFQSYRIAAELGYDVEFNLGR